MKILIIPLTAVGLFLTALTYHHVQQDETTAQSPLPSPVMAQPQAEHEHDLRSPGKPSAAIILASAGVQTLPLMEHKHVQLVLQSHLTEGLVAVRIETDSALELLSPTREWSFDLTESPQLILPVEVRAIADGIHHLHIFIDHLDGQGTSTPRALAVEFSVGMAEGVTLFSKHLPSATQTHPEVVQLSGKEDIF